MCSSDLIDWDFIMVLVPCGDRGGTVAQWLRCRATNRKVAGVTEICH